MCIPSFYIFATGFLTFDRDTGIGRATGIARNALPGADALQILRILI